MTKLMKGFTWAKGKKKLTYPAIAEVKVDEVRCDIRIEGDRVLFQSYADKPLANLEEFEPLFHSALLKIDLTRLDAGVLVNRSFNDTYRWVRSTKGAPADLVDAKIEFILFDLPESIEPFINRRLARNRIAEHLRDYGLPVIVPEFFVINAEHEVLERYEQARNAGNEGLMVKSMDHFYEVDKRTNGWLKVKPEDDADALIHGVTEAISEAGEPLGRVGSIQGATEDGQAVSIPGIDHDTGRAWFADPSLIIGQWVEFQYMERDRQGGFRHPRFNRIREDKQ